MLAILLASFLTVPSAASATECFPSSEGKFPHFLVQRSASAPDYASYSKESYESIVGTDDYIIAGGFITNPDLN